MHIFVFLFITAALQLTDNQVLVLVQDVLSEQYWKGQGFDAAWLFVAYPIGAAIGPLSITRLAPSFRGRRAIVTGLVVLATVQFSFAFTPSFAVALGLRALAGAASGVLSYALLIEAVAHGNRAVTVMTSGFLLAYVLGIPSAAKIAASLGLDQLFILLGVVSMALAVGAATLRLPKHTLSVRTPRRFRDFFRNPVYRAGLATSVLIGAALAGPVAIFPKLLREQGGLNLDDVAVVYYLGGLGPLLAIPFVPRLIRSFGRRRVAIIGAIILVVPLLAMPLGSHGVAAAAAVLLIALALESLRRSALQGHIGSLAPEDDRPRFLALRNVAVQISVSGGVTLAILLRDQLGFSAACGAAAILALCSAACIPPERRNDETGELATTSPAATAT